MKKTKTLTLVARPGYPCPKEGRPRVQPYVYTKAIAETKTSPAVPAVMRDRYCIYHDAPVTVPTSRYYRRRIIAGDLKEVKAAPEKSAGSSSTPTSTKGEGKKS